MAGGRTSGTVRRARPPCSSRSVWCRTASSNSVVRPIVSALPSPPASPPPFARARTGCSSGVPSTSAGHRSVFAVRESWSRSPPSPPPPLPLIVWHRCVAARTTSSSTGPSVHKPRSDQLRGFERSADRPSRPLGDDLGCVLAGTASSSSRTDTFLEPFDIQCPSAIRAPRVGGRRRPNVLLNGTPSPPPLLPPLFFPSLPSSLSPLSFPPPLPPPLSPPSASLSCDVAVELARRAPSSCRSAPPPPPTTPVTPRRWPGGNPHVRFHADNLAPAIEQHSHSAPPSPLAPSSPPPPYPLSSFPLLSLRPSPPLLAGAAKPVLHPTSSTRRPFAPSHQRHRPPRRVRRLLRSYRRSRRQTTGGGRHPRAPSS